MKKRTKIVIVDQDLPLLTIIKTVGHDRLILI